MARIKAPLLLHYAETDTNINAGWPAYEAALKEQGKTYEAYIYPGANHGFHNDSTPRYDEAAAKLAWDRTIAWFKKAPSPEGLIPPSEHIDPLMATSPFARLLGGVAIQRCTGPWMAASALPPRHDGQD